MRRIDVDPAALKAMLHMVARGSTFKKAAELHCTTMKLRTLQLKMRTIYREEYDLAVFKRSERFRKVRAELVRRANNRYANSVRGRTLKSIQIRKYRKMKRYREWEKMCCKAYRAGKTMGTTGSEVMKMWFPHLLSSRWFGVSYVVNEMTPAEIKRSAAAELPVPQHIHLPRIAAH